MNRVLFSSQSVHWPTPKALYRALNDEFHFNFDPCPLGESEADGSAPLFTPWAGKRVFCNPPYDKGIARFLERAREAEIAVFLLPARTDTKWFHDLCLPHATEIRFIKGRLLFGDPTDLSKRAPFPSVLVIFDRRGKSLRSQPPKTIALIAEEIYGQLIAEGFIDQRMQGADDGAVQIIENGIWETHGPRGV